MLPMSVEMTLKLKPKVVAGQINFPLFQKPRSPARLSSLGECTACIGDCEMSRFLGRGYSRAYLPGFGSVVGWIPYHPEKQAPEKKDNTGSRDWGMSISKIWGETKEEATQAG